MSVLKDFTASPELEAVVSETRAAFEAFGKAKSDNPSLWPAIQKKLVVRWTSDSNAIEGSTLSFAETLFFLEEGLTVEGKPIKDFLDARNHADAIGYLMEVIQDKRPITTSLMKELNALLMKGVESTPAIDQQGRKMDKSAAPGEYKKLPNHVLQPDGTIHKYVDPIHVSDEMEELIDWINDQVGKRDPIIVAAIAHYNFVRIHPFDDGNGRGARILMNLVLMKEGLIPAVIEMKQRRFYINFLRKADSGSLQEFIIFISWSLRSTLASIIDDFEQAKHES